MARFTGRGVCNVLPVEGRVIGASMVPNVGIASDNPYSRERGYTRRVARVPPRNRALTRSVVWWPGIDNEILDQSSCVRDVPATDECASYHQAAPMGVARTDRIHVDYAGPMDGKMVLVIIDAHSKYIDVHVVNAAISSATITKLSQTFAIYGLPIVLVSDNATCFKISHFEELCRLNGIQHFTSAPIRSANEAAERAVQAVKAGLRTTEGRNMETRLYRVLLHYRVAYQATTGQAPAELLIRRKPRTRINLVQPDIKDNNVTVTGRVRTTRFMLATLCGRLISLVPQIGSLGY